MGDQGRGFSNHRTPGKITLDPLNAPLGIDIDGAFDAKAKWQGIYKITGDRLTIALNEAQDGRPEHFSTSLTAGKGRARVVLTLKAAGQDALLAKANENPRPSVVAPPVQKPPVQQPLAQQAENKPEPVPSKDDSPPPVKRSEKEALEAMDQAIAQLQGLWLLEKAVQNAKAPWREKDSVYIEDNRFIWVRKDGKMPDNPPWAFFTVDASQIPLKLILEPENRDLRGVASAIFKIENDVLTIAANSSRDAFPAKFSTSLADLSARASYLHTYKRAPSLANEKQPAKYGPKQQLDDALEAEAKALQKLWVLDSQEISGAHGGLARFAHEAIYFEGGRLMWISKTGEMQRNQGDYPKVSLAPLNAPCQIDLQHHDLTYIGIYKFVGDRMVLALNDSRDGRPEYFTTRLNAGKQRARLVLTFKMAASKYPEEKVQPKYDSKYDRDKAIAAELKELQGIWMMEKVKENGISLGEVLRNVPHDSICVEHNKVLFVDKQGNGPGGDDRIGTLSLNPMSSPLAFDLTFDPNEGRAFTGIYKIVDNRLYLAFNPFRDARRPSKFTTDLTAGTERAGIFIVYKKAPAKEPEKYLAKYSANQDRDKVADVELELLQGLWVLDDFKTRGRARFGLWNSPPAMYIEKNTLKWVDNNGNIPPNNVRVSKLTLDPLKAPLAMDIQTDERDSHFKWLAIYKIDGDRLTIATNCNPDTRPGQFSIELSAGPERAIFLRTYRKVTK